jgi:hypothetical protein
MKEPYYDAEDFELGTHEPPYRAMFSRGHGNSWSLHLDQEAFFYWWNAPSGRPLTVALQACIFGWEEE